MERAFGAIRKAASSQFPVLVTGETGTGKELAARAIHALSSRGGKAFIPFNCAALDEGTADSELFGHVRGAFTGAVAGRKGLFEAASGGSLFMDEVGEASPWLQAKLLRALQEGEIRKVGESRALKVDARILAASNRNLENEMSDGRFRSDLFYRLAVIRIWLPPLREHPQDILPLARRFLELADAGRQERHRLSSGAEKRLLAHPWPGNVRELENAVRGAAAMAESRFLAPEDFSLASPPRGRFPEARGPAAAKGPPLSGWAAWEGPVGMGNGLTGRDGRESRPDVTPCGTASLAEARDEAERVAILNALDKWGNRLDRAATALDVSPTTLWRKMRRLRLR